MNKIIALLLAVLMSLSVVAVLSGCQRAEDKGKVIYLNPNPEAGEAWQTLAAQYTEETGVEVRILTAASGAYQDVMSAEMAKEAPPTLFQCANARELEKWADHCLDLTGTEVLAEMTTDEFNLVDENGAVRAIGYCYEAFGMIVNKALLKQAGYEITHITDFASLKAVAEDIHSRADELGFDAFGSMELDAGMSRSFSGNLANMPGYYRLAAIPLFYEFRDEGITEQPAAIVGTYLNAYKNIWDLQLANGCEVSTEPVTDGFAAGKAVFCHQGTWAYNTLKESLDSKDLQMIPVYCGVEGEENAALCCGTQSRWAVNAKASEADIQATLAFLKWVVTSSAGTHIMAEHFGPIPFQAAKEPENVFFADANRLIAEGKYVVGWNLHHAPEAEQWKVGIAASLMDYLAGNGQWSAVETAFVDGWAAQSQQQNN